MTNMLEQAMIDANLLREAAIKRAEAKLLAEAAPKIKEAVDSLLEQDEEEFDLGADEAGLDLGFDADDNSSVAMGPGVESDMASKLSMGVQDGEKLCACPDEEEEVEIDFDQLEQQLVADEEAAGMSQTDLARDLELNLDAGATPGVPNEEEEEINLSEAVIEELLNEEESLEEECSDEKLALEEEELPESVANIGLRVDEALGKDIENIVRSKTSGLYNERDGLLKENKKLKDLLLKLTEQMKEVNLKNAQFMYENHVLKSDSLNERQKIKIVEAIQKAGSVEETKVLYETLIKSVGSSGNTTNIPKSLTEAVEKRSTPLIPKRNLSKNNNSNPERERMKKLAGIAN